MEPKVNEIWRLKSGRLGLIVNALIPVRFNYSEASILAVLWWDEVESDWNVSDIIDRLVEPVEMSIDRFFVESMYIRDMSEPMTFAEWVSLRKASWNSGLTVYTTVRPVKVTIGRQTYSGVFFVAYDKKEGFILNVKYSELKTPKAVFTFNGKQYYSACYIEDIPEKFASMYPFGPEIHLHELTWDIDQYKLRPVRRREMKVEWI